MSDFEALVRINDEISAAEDAGDADALDGHLAPVLAFRRASGVVVDRAGFLAGVKRSGPRRTVTRSVTLLGGSRAFVLCDVTMPVDGEEKTFENARLFVRIDGAWKLLGWANAQAAPITI